MDIITNDCTQTTPEIYIRVCDINVNLVVFCGQTLSGLSETIDSFYQSPVRGSNCVTALLTVLPYELTPDDFEIYLEECEKGTKFERCTQFVQSDKSVYVFMQAGQLLTPSVLRYSGYFFEDSGCPLLFIPVLSEGKQLPSSFDNLPIGGVTSDLSLLIKNNFVCITTKPLNLEAEQYYATLIKAAISYGVFGLTKVSCAGIIGRNLAAQDLYDIVLSTGLTDSIRNLIDDFVLMHITLPLNEADANIELLSSYVSDTIFEKSSVNVYVTNICSYFSNVEIEGLFYPEDKDSKLTVDLDNFEIHRIVENVQDMLLPRYFFWGRRCLVNDKTKITFKQGHNNIQEVAIAEDIVNNYTVAANGNVIEITMCPYFKLTCIIPVYNDEMHLSEAVSSIINGELDFLPNVQIVLVNDGSTDGSHCICQSLAERYPYNVKYVQIEHSGVSVARNIGMSFAMGQYIMFVDADDTLDSNLLQLGVKYLDNKKNDDIDFIVFPLKLFGIDCLPDSDLDFRFAENDVIDIRVEPQKVQYSACGVLMRSCAIKHLTFDTDLTVGEDAEFMYRAFSEKQTYLTCKDAFYNYRIGPSKYGDEIYLAIRQLADALGGSSDYAQYTIMQSLRRVVLTTPAQGEVKDDATFDNAIACIAQAISYVSNETITNARHFTRQQKEYMLCLKHGAITITNNAFYAGEEYIQSFATDINIDYMRERNGCLAVSGYFCLPIYTDVTLIATHMQEEYQASLCCDDRHAVTICNRQVYGGKSFEFSIPLASLCDGEIITFKLKYHAMHGNVNPVLQQNYIFIGRSIIVHAQAEEVRIDAATPDKIADVLQNMGKKEHVQEFISMYPLMSNSRIWLFVDSGVDVLEQSAARHMYEHSFGFEDGIIKHLVLSADETGLLADDGVIAYNSKTYLLMCMFAEKIIVSDPNEIIRLCKLSSLITADFVYLPNNVLTAQDRLWLQELTGAPIELIALISDEEREFLPNGMIKTSASHVLGNPRFDALVNHGKPRILFMPSFRKHLYIDKDRYNPAFKDSEYAIKIGDLLLEEQFLDVADELGISVDFAPHENTYIQSPDFEMDESITVVPLAIPRFGMSQNAAMLITDTLPAYDFAYLGKPVVYYQFDSDGTFPQDGACFGENVTDFDELVQLLRGYMQSGFALKPQYSQAVEGFFAQTRGKSCQLIYRRLTETSCLT